MGDVILMILSEGYQWGCNSCFLHLCAALLLGPEARGSLYPAECDVKYSVRSEINVRPAGEGLRLQQLAWPTLQSEK